MAHAEVVLPYTVSVGFEAELDFPVDIIRDFSGHEFRNLNAEDSVRQYRATMKGKTRAQSAELYKFVMARGVSAQSFNHKDHFDYSVSIDEGVVVALGNGQFQLYKRYASTGNRDRKVLKLDVSDLVVKAGAVTLTLTTHYTVDATTGIVTMVGSPTTTPTAWSVGLYYTPVRFVGPFSIRSLDEDPELFTWGAFGMVEVLNP